MRTFFKRLLQTTGSSVLPAVLAAACAHAPPRLGPSSGVRLAVLPVDRETFPKVASAIDDAFASASVPGVDEVFRSKVSLEVVQLSIECVDATDGCYTTAGRSIPANRLLLARLVAGDRGPRSVHVVIELFDVDRGEPLRTAEKTFNTEDQAVPVMRDMVSQVTTGGVGEEQGASASAPESAP